MIAGHETIEIIRKDRVQGPDDRYGNPTWVTVRVPVENVLVGWGGTSTSFDVERTLITSAATIYLPEGTEVLEGDEFIVRGKRYRKDGEAQYWEPPSGFALSTGVVVALTRAEG